MSAAMLARPRPAEQKMPWAKVTILAGNPPRMVHLDAGDRWAALDFVNGTLHQAVPELAASVALRYENLFELTLFVEPGTHRLNMPEVELTIVSHVREWFAEERAA
jgi:hypothetical protein